MSHKKCCDGKKFRENSSVDKVADWMRSENAIVIVFEKSYVIIIAFQKILRNYFCV